MLTEIEIRAIAQTVVDRSKRTAKVDQGSLRKSISYTYVRGVVTFRELFYGQWNDNSQLEDNAKYLMPNGVAWKIIYTKLGGEEYEVGKTRQGRSTKRSSLRAVQRTGTDRIKALIASVKKKDGKKKE